MVSRQHKRAKGCTCNKNTLCDSFCQYQQQETAVYELSDGYVGISYQPEHRLRAHQQKTRNNALTITHIKWYQTRSEALEEEWARHRAEPTSNYHPINRSS